MRLAPRHVPPVVRAARARARVARGRDSARRFRRERGGAAARSTTIPRRGAAERPPRARAPEPLDAWAPIAARDVFNGRRARAPSSDGPRRLVGVGLQGDDARAVIEDRGHAPPGALAGRRRGRRRARRGDRRGTTSCSPAPAARRSLELAPPRPPAASPTTRRAAAEPVRRPARTTTHPPHRRRTRFVVDRREIAGAVDNMSGLLTQLRAVAEMRDGRPAGFRLFRIQDDSIFRRLGLANGDVVQRVNGSAVADPGERCSRSCSACAPSRASRSTSCAATRRAPWSTTSDDARCLALRSPCSAPAPAPPTTPPSRSTSRTSRCPCWPSS